MRILKVQKINGIAGSEKYLIEIMSKLLALGHDVHFLLLYEKKQIQGTFEFIKLLEAKNIPYKQVEVNFFTPFGTLKRLKNEVDTFNPDLVNTHLIYADLILSVLRMFFKPKWKLVSTKHGFDELLLSKYGFEIPIRERFNKYILLARFAEKNIDASFAVSSAIRNLFIKLKICKSNKIGLIYHGFNYPAPLENKLNENRSGFLIATVGRLSPFKGHKFLIEALSKVKTSIPDFNIKLVLLGDGPEKSNLKDLVNNLGLGQCVQFLGFQPKPENWVKDADLLVIPSVVEPFGLVLLEAFAQKKCVITFDVPAFNEIIENENTGFLIEPFNTSALAHKIIKVLKTPEVARQIGENAYQKLNEYYTLERMTNQTIEFYQEVAEGNRR
jgi:glycosyltransferase involved in cell wall biosynthesis